MFDYGVNSGIGRSGKVLHRMLGLPDDGRPPPTMLRGRRHADANMIVAICDERLRFLQSLRTWPVFGKGWGRRVAEVKAFALHIAARAPAPTPAAVAAAPPARRGAVPKGAQQGSAAAVVAAGAAAAQQAHQTGAGDRASSPSLPLPPRSAPGCSGIGGSRQQEQPA